MLVLTKVTDLRALGMSPADLPESCVHIPKSTIISTEQLLAIVDDVLGDRGSRHRQRTPSGPLAALSRSQLDVLRRAAQGYSTPEIARQRNCTTSAVEKLLGSVYLDLGLSAGGPLVPRSEAIRVYITHAGIPDRP
jgi:DNA-binding NarL/FixJ family response regulator